MSEPFIGEIQIYAFPFAPKGWAFCNGQTMGIAQNQALFSLLGVTFGGNGSTTFNLPDLRGRSQVAQGQGQGLSNYVMGQTFGDETVTLQVKQMPPHSHPLKTVTSAAGNSSSPVNNYYGIAPSGVGNVYGGTADTGGSLTAVPSQGGQSHPNRQPYLVLNFCISLTGIFPPRN